MNHAYAVHADLSPMTAWVDVRVFQDMQGESTWTKVKVYGLTCLPGRVPAFDVMTPEGYLFSNVPTHLLRWQRPDEDDQATMLPLSSLVYLNCPAVEFSLELAPFLVAQSLFAYFKAEASYVAADHWFGLDFYTQGVRVHALKLKNGQLAFVPNHKLLAAPQGKLPENHQFPEYRRLCQQFSVEK